MSGDRWLARMAQRVRFDSVFWRRFAYLGCVYGPEWWLRYSPPVIAATIFALVGRNRRGAILNMRRILALPPGERGPAAVLARRMFAQFALCMTETMGYYGPHPRRVRLDLPERDPLAEALTDGRGAVVVTGHFGNWDIAAKTLREYGSPVNIVMAREANATTHEFVRAARERVGVRVIYSDTSVFSSLNMIRALRRNEIVALQLDRMLGPGGARSVPFFGVPALFPSGPFVLARLSGAPLVPVFVPRLGRRHYAIRVGHRFTLPRESQEAGLLERVMGEVMAEFETIIREFPMQWFQFSPFWPDSASSVEIAPAAEGGANKPEESPPTRQTG